MGDPAIGTNRKSVTLGASTTLLRLLHPHRASSRQTIMGTLTLHIPARVHLFPLLLSATPFPVSFTSPS